MGMKARRRWVPVDSVSGTAFGIPFPGEQYKEGSKILGYIRCSVIPLRWLAHCESAGSALVDTKAEARAWVKEHC